jgi:hypothetical protein
MSRQMEYDADRCQARLVGSPLVASVLRRVNVVLAAERGAFVDLGENWKEGRLADDLPRLIAANVEQLPPQAMQAIDAGIERGRTGLFDTHPADRDRIASAVREDAPGVFHLDGPATDLFRDFDALAQAATADYYRGVFGPQFTPDHLLPVAEIVRGTEDAEAGRHAVDRLFLGRFTPYRPLPLPAGAPAQPGDPKAALRALKELRGELPVAREGYGAALDRQGEAFGTLIKAQAAATMSRCDFKYKAADYDVPRASLDAARSASDAATRKMDDESAALDAFEQVIVRRLSLALGLLEHEAVAKRMEDPEAWRGEARALYPVAAFLVGRVWPKLMPLARDRIALLSVLQHYQGNEQNERLVNAILRGGRDLHDRLQELAAALGGEMLYPFDHAAGEVTLKAFALPSIPDAGAIGELIETAEAALDRLLPLHSRLLGRLTLAAEAVETALGLPLLEPSS